MTKVLYLFMDRGQIKKQAKQILDKFSRALSGVKIKEMPVEREDDRREESGEEGGDEDFRKIMLKNAPKTKDGCIETEKGGWLE